MNETPAQRMFRQIQEMRDAFPNGFGLLDGVKAELAEKDATIAALRERLARVEALAEHFATIGITCACGHDVGGEHNSAGCYAALSYQPLVRCNCLLTDDQDESTIVARAIREALHHD